VPHVTLGQFTSLDAINAKIAELSSQPTVEFDLDYVSLLGRTATGPFKCKLKAELGLLAALPGSTSSTDPYSEDFGSLFSSQSMPVSSFDIGESNTADSQSDFWSVIASFPPVSEEPKTKSKRVPKSSTASGFKSSYYKDKPSPITSTSKTEAPKNSGAPSSLATATASSASPSKYAIKIEAPKAPTFSSFATSSSASTSTGANLGLPAFSPSKPPAPIVISSPKSALVALETKSAEKSPIKPKTSSYYAAKKTHIGRAPSPTSSEPMEAITFEASSISISAEFDNPMEPTQPEYKVIADRKGEPTPLPAEFQPAVDHILQWLITLEHSKRPKTRVKLGNAIAKMCTIATAGMTADEALQMLIAKSYISIAGDNISILNKGDKSVQRYNMNLHRQNDYQTPEEAATERCVTWILDPDSKPKTKASLLNALQQLVQVKKQLSSASVVQYILESGHITALQDSKGAEFLDYHL